MIHWAQIKVAATYCCIVLAGVSVIGVPVAFAARQSGQPESDLTISKRPLKGLPSEPEGSHLEKVKGLGDNEWVSLGKPAPDPKWGDALGRSWGGKAFVLAPDIRGAYFTGEGNHAYVKPDGYGADDYWVYDINAHRWICIYPGTHIKEFAKLVEDGDLSVNEHGLVVNRQGQLMPAHLLVHAWGFLAYDTDRNQFAILKGGRHTPGYTSYFFPGAGYYNRKGRFPGLDEALKKIQGQMKAKAVKNLSPWFYDTATGEFECYPIENRCPVSFGHDQFFYIPTKKQYLAVTLNRKPLAYFDPDGKRWTAVKAKGTGPSGYDIGACYDSKRDRVYIGAFGPKGPKGGGQNSILAYDIGTETWIALNAEGERPQWWSTNNCSVHYDTVNDIILVLHYSDKKLYIYDPEKNVWLAPITFPKGTMQGMGYGHAFYDPELNAHFVFFGNDSRPGGIMCAYRYKK